MVPTYTKYRDRTKHYFFFSVAFKVRTVCGLCHAQAGVASGLCAQLSNSKMGGADSPSNCDYVSWTFSTYVNRI